MTIAAAVDITASDQDQLIAAAANFAQQRGEKCFVISIVRSLTPASELNAVIAHNLALITSRNVAPIVQEGADVAKSLRAIAEKFGVRTMFIRNGRRRFGRTMAERLIHLKPSFEVVVSPGL